MLKYLKLMRKLGHWHIYNWYRVLIGPGEGRRCVRMITAFRIVLKKCFVFQCSGSRPIFAWEKRKSGLEDAKMNISVGALALNAHNEHFWQFFVFRRSMIEAANVLGGISKFGYVHFINDIAFHHTNCNWSRRDIICMVKVIRRKYIVFLGSHTCICREKSQNFRIVRPIHLQWQWDS